MKHIITICLLINLIACGKWFNKKSSTQQVNLKDQLTARLDLYTELNKSHIDIDGWILARNCDSLLFTSLAAIGRNEKINILAARNAEGQWFRTPGKDCYPDRSPSTISRDMFLGLIWYMFKFNEQDLINELWDYGVENNWKMGQAKDLTTILGRVQWTPSMIALLAEVRYQRNGIDSISRNVPFIYSTEPGFTSHLSLVTIALQGEMLNGISGQQLDVINEILSHSPTNIFALAIKAKYTDGNMDSVIRSLLQQYPVDRLPTKSLDWCEEWRPQRKDTDKSLSPCSQVGEHTGADFIFLGQYILERM